MTPTASLSSRQQASTSLRRAPARDGLALLLLALVSLAPFLNAGRTVLFFDSLQLDQAPEAKSPALAWRDLLRTAFQPGQEFSTLTFAANYAINTSRNLPGLDPAGFIFVNIALHILNVWLLYALMRTLLRRTNPGLEDRWGWALLAAALFAVHPLHVSTLLYVVQRRGLLASIFQLTGLLTYLRLRDAKSAAARVAWTIATLAAFWFCMKSRSNGLAMPLMLLAVEFVLRLGEAHRLRRFLAAALAISAVAMVVMFVFLWKAGLFDPDTLTVKSSPTLTNETDWGALQQALTQASIYPRYAALIVWPAPSSLCIDHVAPIVRDTHSSAAWAWVALHLAILAASIYLGLHGYRLITFGVLLACFSQATWLFSPQPAQCVEYRLYLALAGAAFIVLGIVLRLPAGAPQKLAAAALCLTTLTLAVLTAQRNTIFSSPVRIWQDVAEKYPGQFRAEYNLGNALFHESRLDEAAVHYAAACRIDPADYRAHYNLANTLLKLGRRDDAAREYAETLRRKPDHAGAREGLAALGVSRKN